MHHRRVIREAVVALLQAGETDAGDRVFKNRVLPMRIRGDKAELPAILVYSLEEDVDDDSATTAPRELTRRLSLAVDALAVGADEEVDDDLDQLAEQIEAVMHADPFLGGVAADSILGGTIIEFDGDGERVIGRVGLTYEVTYRLMAPKAQDGADQDDFETAATTYSMGGDQAEADAAKDEFNVEDPES